jgi:hypothetical protein
MAQPAPRTMTVEEVALFNTLTMAIQQHLPEVRTKLLVRVLISIATAVYAANVTPDSDLTSRSQRV